MIRFIFPFLIICPLVSLGQEHSDHPEAFPDSVNIIHLDLTAFGPTIGYRGFRNHFLELGVFHAGVGHGMVGWELNLLSNLKKNDPVHGLSVGYITGFAFFEVGLRGTAYTNFDQITPYAQPSFGMGWGGFATVNYGINIPVWKNHFKEQVSLHEVRLIFRWDVSR